MPEYTHEQQVSWQNSLPTKRTASLAALRDRTGKVFIVKPNYRPTWSLVGGVIDENEAPLDAIIREVHEETGLEIDDSRFVFLGVEYTPPYDGFNDFLTMIFEIELTDQEVADIKLQASELDDGVWVTAEDLPEKSVRGFSRAISELLLSNIPAAYSEQGKITTPSLLKRDPMK